MSATVVMELLTLRPVDVAFPEGYEVRTYRFGDEDTWVAIQSRADQYNVISRELFQSEFEGRVEQLAQRQFFTVDGAGSAVATVTAWLPQSGLPREWGRLHWLAVDPDLQRRGIGGALVALTINRLRELGHTQAYLTTEPARGAAIRLYERFGFREVDQLSEARHHSHP